GGLRCLDGGRGGRLGGLVLDERGRRNDGADGVGDGADQGADRAARAGGREKVKQRDLPGRSGGFRGPRSVLRAPSGAAPSFGRSRCSLATCVPIVQRMLGGQSGERREPP